MSRIQWPDRRWLVKSALVALAVGLNFGSAFMCSRAADYVIHVSIDGLNALHMQQAVDAGHAPTLERLEAESARTANDPPARRATLHNAGNRRVLYIASVFDVAHDAGLSTALYASKDKFVIYDQTYSENTGAAGPHGRDKIDRYFYQDDGPPSYSAGMHHRFLSDLARHHFNYSFVHYRDPDSVGHEFGWGSAMYNRAVAVVDGYLADVLSLGESDATLAGRTAIIIATAHGRGGLRPGGTHAPPNNTTPRFGWG